MQRHKLGEGALHLNARQVANYDGPSWSVITFVAQNNLITFVLRRVSTASALPCLCVRYDVPAEFGCGRCVHQVGLPFVVCRVLLRPCGSSIRERLSTCQAFCPTSFAYKTRHFAQLEHLFGFCRLKMQRAHRCGCARAMSRRPIEDALSIARSLHQHVHRHGPHIARDA